jgi:hypothetical protein
LMLVEERELAEEGMWEILLIRMETPSSTL